LLLSDADKTRAAEEVFRLSQELANSRKALEMKNMELSTALTSFAEHQKKVPHRPFVLSEETQTTSFMASFSFWPLVVSPIH
jgi:hypothetical protein